MKKPKLLEAINFKLAACVAKRLTELGHADVAKLVVHCDNATELHSFLRDRVFHKDAKTTAFIQQCEADLRVPAPGENPMIQVEPSTPVTAADNLANAEITLQDAWRRAGGNTVLASLINDAIQHIKRAKSKL